MSDKVDVVYSHHSGDHKPGDKVSLDAAEAKTLVNAGYAQYATIPDAKQAGGDRSEAKTATPAAQPAGKRSE